MRADFRLKNWQKYKSILPVLSFMGAVFSSIRMTRDFSNGWKLLVFAAGIWVVLFLFSLWLEFVDRAFSDGEDLPKGLGKLVSERGKVEWLTLAAAQLQAQYVLLFSLPFLYWAQSWSLFSVTALVTVSTLWDPWWQKLITQSWYAGFVRSLSFVLATSFVIAIVAPRVAPFVQPVALGVGALASVPWRAVFRMRRNGFVYDFPWTSFGALGVWIFFGVLALSGGRSIPLLSVWVSSRAAIGFNVVDRNLEESLSGAVSLHDLRQRFSEGKKLCCWTPIVAPQTLQSKMEHVWTVDGHRVVDVIPVGDVVGIDENHAFRTFSCKSALEVSDSSQSLECRVRLEGRLDIGGTSLHFR
jgi:hypothetical protein